MKWICILFALFAMTASAADVAGTWKASIETPNGNFETTFVFKVEGAKLTGTVASAMGESELSEGKIDGENLSFVVVRNFQGAEVKMTYKGKVKGNEIGLTLEIPGMDRAFDMVAKKVS